MGYGHGIKESDKQYETQDQKLLRMKKGPVGRSCTMRSTAHTSPVSWSIQADLPGCRTANHIIRKVPNSQSTQQVPSSKTNRGWRTLPLVGITASCSDILTPSDEAIHLGIYVPSLEENRMPDSPPRRTAGLQPFQAQFPVNFPEARMEETGNPRQKPAKPPPSHPA